MAQISKGIRLGYMVSGTSPKAYTFLPDLTGIPALGATPSTHQRTTLNDSMHRYIKGLVDVGGNLDFPCIFTDDIIDAVDTAITAQGSSTLEWAVEFPLPLGKRMYFTGEVSKAFNESVDVDAPITGTVSIVPTGSILMEDAEYVVAFDTDGGSAVTSQTIKYGGLVSEPADPTLSGFTFGGWYYDEAYTDAVVFSSAKVEGAMTLYAKWDVE
jgi:uncharacterized repeat protein (TIGR02543 family)